MVDTSDSAPDKPDLIHTPVGHGAAREETILADKEFGAILDVVLWAGQLLLQHGASTQRVEETIHRMGTGLGFDWMDIALSLNSIVATGIQGETFRTKVRRVVFDNVDMALVTAVNDLGRRASTGKLSLAQVKNELTSIDQQEPSYNRVFVTIMIGLAGAGFARLLDGDLFTMLTVFIAIIVSRGVMIILQRRYFNPYLIITVTAFVAALVASGILLAGSASKVNVAIIAAILPLIPGPTLINATQDIMKGHLANGLTRALLGVFISFLIVLGVIAALQFTGFDWR